MNDSPRCNICGHAQFGPGPGGRLSYDGKTPPRCTGCQSLERHRAFRAVFDALRSPEFATLSVLQFSRDRSNDPRWFARHEVSVYAGENSLDLQRINRPDASYDVVVCNHVLEHVADDRAALRELARVVRPGGFVFLSTPDPLRRETTADWGYADESKHGHYRIYGRDIERTLRAELAGLGVLAVTGVDPATGGTEALFLITPSASRLAHLASRLRGEHGAPGFEQRVVLEPISAACTGPRAAAER